MGMVASPLMPEVARAPGVVARARVNPRKGATAWAVAAWERVWTPGRMPLATRAVADQPASLRHDLES